MTKGALLEIGVQTGDISQVTLNKLSSFRLVSDSVTKEQCAEKSNLLHRKSGNLSIELLFGPHKNYTYPQYGVRITSAFTGMSKSYLYNDFKEAKLTKRIIQELELLGTCNPVILENLRSHAEDMKEDGSITSVPDLLVCIKDSISVSDAEMYFELIVNYVRDNIDKFPSERSRELRPSDIQGMRLDTDSSLRLHGAYVVAVKVDIVEQILTHALKHTLVQVKNGLKDAGVLVTKNVVNADYSIQIDLGWIFPKECVLFRINI